MGRNSDKRAARVAETWVPTRDEHYEPNPAAYDAIWRCVLRAGRTAEPQNAALVGPAGSGKTSLCLHVAAERGTPTFLINFATAQSADELFGLTTFREGRTMFDASLLLRGLQTPGATIILNDLALLQNRTVQNGLNEMLDPTTRRLYVPGLGRTVQVAQRVVFLATWNVGAEYTGNVALARNIENRFPVTIYVDPPNATQLARIVARRTGITAQLARKIVRYATALRDDEDAYVSTRNLIAAGEQMTEGATLPAAIYATMIGRGDPATRERLLQIVQGTSTYLQDADDWNAWATAGDRAEAPEEASDETA